MTYIHKSTGESVARETWRWIAEYDDGSVLKQFDDSDMSFHQFAEIDQSRLVGFRMVHDTTPECVLVFPQGAKLVHKYINSVLRAGTDDEALVRVYAYGYQINGLNFFNMIMPDGSVIHTDDFNKVGIS